ncbi:MAG: 3-methyl-2-oxobutanoate dehydrogenase subunit VorB [Methanomassiliicoccales archaeon]|nr:3-methyl-2-oxobutanoate dehydrogenase subunit VorB [Methanomassiliicoccales archaeon]MDD7479346.1 3-methyl-2-oxobutanoate dehydrogenase subunit VorB [Methanomassiliicoccales archaeon]
MGERVLMKGNEAIAEAAIAAGCRHFFGYPITPQTEVAAYMSKRMPKIGGVYLQAESEVASINMVLGAAASGVRAMTSTSSPGVSLMSEGISYLAGSDVPCLIVNVQRGGPGLGGIQPSQSDYYQATRSLGHGDFHLVVFAPSTVQETVDLISDAFDLGDKYRVPTMVLSDGMLGQMMEPVVLPEPKEPDNASKGWAACGHQNKRPHNVINSLNTDPPTLERMNVDRFKRYAQIIENEQRAEEYMCDDADIIVVAFGASSRVSRSAVDKARADGIKVGLIRPITLWPFPEKILKKHVDHAKVFLDVEMNMGQMIDDVKLAIDCKRPVEFYGRTGGMIPTTKEVYEKIVSINGGIQ